MRKPYTSHVLEEMEYHNKTAKAYIETSKRDLIWQVPEKIIFAKYLGQNKSWVLLDLGCGSAENIKRNILPHMRAGDGYIGVDVSEELLNKAKQNMPRGKFIQAPMGNLKIPKESVDFICFFGSLHHDEYPKKTFKKIASFLKPGGSVFLREPQEKAFKKGYGASPHEAGISPQRLKRWLKGSSFEILEWHFLNTAPFHLIRRLLNKLKLSGWEEMTFLWKVKVWLEMILEKLFVGPLRFLEGTDMFIVARKQA